MSEPRAYYNEIDKDAVAVLDHLIADGVIAPGVVDSRSIKDIRPDDLTGFTQCHFFAGGGLWSVAARLAGWPDSRPLWTGSCPCQPFSAAGKGLGTDDPRHLWPDFHRLIRGAGAAGFGPAVVMGEQVSGAAGYNWLDGVRADLAEEGYACRARDIPALAVDAPHERNRLYWIAVADGDSSREFQRQGNVAGERGRTDNSHALDLVDLPSLGRREGRSEPELRSGRAASASTDASGGAVGNSDSARALFYAAPSRSRSTIGEPDGRNGSFWAEADWILCHDGKARRTKPGLPLLVDGLPGRVGLWRLAGNAISPVLAAEVIAAFMDAEQASWPSDHPR